MPQPSKDTVDHTKMVFNFDNALPGVNVKDGGLLTTMTADKLPLLGKVGLGANVVKLDANAMSSPMYTIDSSVQLTYIVKGSGRVQVVALVGIAGKRVLDAEVQTSHLFVVPKIFVLTEIGDGEGMEIFSVVTSPRQAPFSLPFTHLSLRILILLFVCMYISFFAGLYLNSSLGIHQFRKL
ncbi:cocosin 1-like [Cornus florida]|uniref:cocosin 1-like n=1 Tax=Cornus florida TaxID=4283 RepID=UPI00289C5550|nr:cocosin 1-like [Cornus florida]